MELKICVFHRLPQKLMVTSIVILCSLACCSGYRRPQRQVAPFSFTNPNPSSIQKGAWCRTAVGIWGQCAWMTECALHLPLTSWAPAPTFCSTFGPVPLICCPLNYLNKPKSEAATTGMPLTTRTRETTTQRPRNTTTQTTSTRTTTQAPSKDMGICGRAPGAPPQVTGNVVGGTVVIPHSRPWMVVLGERRRKNRMWWFCGGVLITPSVVMTAAHCLYSSRRLDVVRLGAHNLESGNSSFIHQDFRVAKTKVHPRYNPPAMAHDLALLLLTRPAEINEAVVPVCLPRLPKRNSDGRGSPVLKEASVTVVPLSSCRKAYKTLIGFKKRFPGGLSESFLCAGHVNGTSDACQGDSGGPLIYEGDSRGAVLAGVVAAGYGCGHKDFPGLYTNTLPHLRWIKTELAKFKQGSLASTPNIIK